MTSGFVAVDIVSFVQ